MQVAKYDPENFSWKDRVKYVINKFGTTGIAEIIKEIQLLEPDTYSKDFLNKRVGITVSQLKKGGVIEAKKDGKRFVYFIK